MRYVIAFILVLMVAPYAMAASCVSGLIGVGDTIELGQVWQKLDASGPSTALGSNATIEIAYRVTGTTFNWWNGSTQAWSGTQVANVLDAVGTNNGSYALDWAPNSTVAGKTIIVTYIDGQATDTTVTPQCTLRISPSQVDVVVDSINTEIQFIPR